VRRDIVSLEILQWQGRVEMKGREEKTDGCCGTHAAVEKQFTSNLKCLNGAPIAQPLSRGQW
jgi:hypothetical protein